MVPIAAFCNTLGCHNGYKGNHWFKWLVSATQKYETLIPSPSVQKWNMALVCSSVTYRAPSTLCGTFLSSILAFSHRFLGNHEATAALNKLRCGLADSALVAYPNRAAAVGSGLSLVSRTAQQALLEAHVRYLKWCSQVRQQGCSMQ